MFIHFSVTMKNYNNEGIALFGVFVCVLIYSTVALPVSRQDKLTQLNNILNGLETIGSEYHSDQNENSFQKHENRKKENNYDLLIELKEPVKIKAIPDLISESALNNGDDTSGVNKRQGKWDRDYGLGGGRWGKRGRGFEYEFGGGRFGRDLDHVDPSQFEDEND